MRGVKYFRHLVVVNAVEVTIEGGMSVLVFEGFGFAFVMSMAFAASGRQSRWGKGVVIEVSGRRGELILRGQVVKQIGRTGLVSGSQVGSWSSLSHTSFFYFYFYFI